MRTQNILKLTCLLLLLLGGLGGCSKSEQESPITPEPGENPSANPDPDSNTSTQEDITRVDEQLSAFMNQYGVPGAALAVSINEKLVYSQGYGMANTDQQEIVSADDAFRIASISKVFTATAILDLIDRGLLNLDDPVFGPQGILGEDFGSAQLTEEEKLITVDHLLLHELGGWGLSSGGDPIDYQPGLDPIAFIEYVLNDWPLANAPGTAFSYSNTGYWLLARIVEKISGMSFEEYLGDMLTPLGITTFWVTTFRENDLQANEVRYYGTDSDSPYIYSIASRRDGDGGIVISAPDLLRFLTAIDGNPVRPDILSSSSIELLSSTSAHSNLGRGLAVWPEQQLTYFTGSLPGNRSWFMIADNGRTAAILLNFRRPENPQFDQDLQSLLLSLVKNNDIPWQTQLDQF